MLSFLFLQKITLSILIGALLGLEREYTKKQEIAGLRTFALTSLFGCLSVILSKLLENTWLIFIGFLCVSCFAILLYLNRVLKHAITGFTTNISLMLTFILGIFVGFEWFIEAIFLGILIAVILYSKERMHKLIRHLTEKEVSDLLGFLILLGIIGVIIPKEVVVFDIVVPLLTIWLLVVIISLINLSAFISARYLSPAQEIGAVSFIGGLISSTALIGSLTEFYRHNKKLLPIISAGFLLATAAMVLRNFFLVMIVVPEMIKYLVFPLLFCITGLIFSAYLVFRKKKVRGKLQISSPFNVKAGIRLGIFILVFYVLLNIARKIGSGIFLISVFGGGLADSLSTTVSIIGLGAEGVIGLNAIAIGVLLACFGSILSNYILCYYKKSPKIATKNNFILLATLIFTSVILGLMLFVIK